MFIPTIFSRPMQCFTPPRDGCLRGKLTGILVRWKMVESVSRYLSKYFHSLILSSNPIGRIQMTVVDRVIRCLDSMGRHVRIPKTFIL